MRIEDFYASLLKLTLPWFVKTVVSSGEMDIIDVHIGYVDDARFFCPVCGRRAGAAGESSVKTWRHLDTCGKKTCLHAALPVVDCPDHGRQCSEPSWATADSPVTSALEELCLQLAKDFGGVKVAAKMTGVGPTDIRKILRTPRQPDRTGKPPAHDHPAKSAEEGPHKPHAKQLTLFAHKDMPLINEGMQALKNLHLERAIELFGKHKKLFPKSYDAAAKMAMAEFLLDGIRRLPTGPLDRPGHLCRLWRAFEDYARAAGALHDTIVPKMKTALFEQVTQAAEQAGLDDSAWLTEDLPLGYAFLQAGQYGRAIQCLQACILQAPDRAVGYGYLGDAYWLRGDHKTARQCYREACLIDPAALDWHHLQDEELKELNDDLLLEYGFDKELTVAWLPSHAIICGLFERKTLRLHDGLKETVDRYLTLHKAAAKKRDPHLPPRLFLLGIVLCDNEESLKFIKKIDPIQVRKQMQQANPDLFAEFLKKLAAQPAP